MMDFKGAALMFDAISGAKALLGDKGYDADWFRHALKARGIEPCIPPKSNRKTENRSTRRSIKTGTRSRTCLGKSKTGNASTRDTTVAPTPSCQPSQSL